MTIQGLVYRLRYAALAALLVVASLATSASAAQPQYVLKLATFLPATARVTTDFLNPWIDALQSRTHGKVKVQFYGAGTPFGNILNLEDEVHSGVVDIAFGVCSIPRGRFPETSIVSLPFMAPSGRVTTHVVWSLYKEGYLHRDYHGYKVLAIFSDDGGWIHTHSKAVRTLADIKGLRIRAVSPIIALDLKQLGATPVGMPPSQIYVNLERGTLDGAVFEWNGVSDFHLNDVVNYHTDMVMSRDTFYFLMNKHKYETLPADVRATIDAISEGHLEPKFAGLWKKWDRAARLDAKKRGQALIYLSSAEQARWHDALRPVTAQWLHHLKASGVRNAQAIYRQARLLVKRYAAK